MGHPLLARRDADGLRQLAERAPGEELRCEPALAALRAVAALTPAARETTGEVVVGGERTSARARAPQPEG